MSLFTINSKNVLHFSQLDELIGLLLEEKSDVEMMTLWVPGTMPKSVSLNRFNGELSLDLMSPPVVGLVRRIRFKLYCKFRGLDYRQEIYGTLVWVRARLGSEFSQCIEVIEGFFQEMYEHDQAVQYSLMDFRIDS